MSEQNVRKESKDGLSVCETFSVGTHVHIHIWEKLSLTVQ